MTGTTADHYSQHSAKSYDSAFFSSDEDYVHYLTKLIQEKFKWRKNENDASITATSLTLLDIGGGTGTFTKRLIDEYPSFKAIVMEPFLETSKDAYENNNDKSNISFCKASADDFLREDNLLKDDVPILRTGYHHVLMKEMIHHITESNRTAIFRAIHTGFQTLQFYHDSAAALLIVTRPKYDIDYPLWPAANKIWEANQPDPQSIIQDLEDAGFQKVVTTTHAFACRVNIERWKRMIQRRFWSTFSSFTDAELLEACKTYDDHPKLFEDGNLHFEDRLIFITAYL